MTRATPKYKREAYYRIQEVHYDYRGPGVLLRQSIGRGFKYDNEYEAKEEFREICVSNPSVEYRLVRAIEDPETTSELALEVILYYPGGAN